MKEDVGKPGGGKEPIANTLIPAWSIRKRAKLAEQLLQHWLPDRYCADADGPAQICSTINLDSSLRGLVVGFGDGYGICKERGDGM